MDNYSARIEIQDGEIQKILDRLTQAQEEIYSCYTELENLGIVVIRPREETGKGKRTASGN